MRDTNILLIGTDRPSAEDLRSRLEGLNFTVRDLFFSGAECLSAAGRGGADLVVMDMDGADESLINEAVDSFIDRTDIPVIFLSSLRELTLVRDPSDLDRFECLISPIPDRDLYAAVVSALTAHSLRLKLAESEGRYRELVDIMGTAILKTDRQGLIVFSNRYCDDLFGYGHDVMMGKKISDLIVSSEERPWPPCFEGTVETECRTAAGERLFLLWNVHALGECADGYRETIHVGNDITRRKNAENELLWTKEWLETIFNLSPSHIVVTRLQDATILGVNETCLRDFGLSREEVVGRTAALANIPFTFMDRRSFLLPLMEKGAVHDYEDTVVNDGAARYYSINATIIDIDGEQCVLSVINDTTDRKSLQVELEKQRKLLYDIIDFLPDPTFVVDARGEVIVWNRAMEETTGASKKRMIGEKNHRYSLPFYNRQRPMLIDIVLDDISKWRNEYDSIHRAGATLSAETKVVIRNESKDFFAKAAPLFDASGTAIGSIEILRDITEIKNIEEALRQSELRYRAIFESSGIPTAMTSASGAIRLMNRKFADLTGLGPESLSGRANILDIIEGLDPARRRRMFRGVETDEDREVSLILKTASGETKHVLLQGIPVPDSSEVIINLVDITEKKALEKAVFEAGIREQKIIGQMLHDELGQILTGTGFLCESLVKTLVDLPAARERAQEIFSLIDRARNVTHLAAYGLLPVNLSSGGLSEALHYLAENTSKIYNVNCRVRHDESLSINDSLIETQLYYIAHQSVANAIKHGSANKINIFLGMRKDHLSLIIDDDGSGIPAQGVRSHGLGIGIMRYRAQSINCRLSITGRMPRGTRVSCIQ